MSEVIGLILAAGASSRMGIHKALLKIVNRTLLEDQAQRLRDSGLQDVLVVIGAKADEVRDSHRGLSVNWIENKSWEKGNFSSVLCGLRAVKDRRGVLLLPIDVVGIEPKTIREIVNKGTKTNRNIIPTFGGRGGHPVYLTQCLVSKIISEHSGDDRLDQILASDPRTSREELGSPSILNNINTKEEWKRHQKNTFQTR